jgi:uncharacterized protein (TIGR02246 family)
MITLSASDVRQVVDVYIKAWMGQDPDLIVTVFTADATYREGVLNPPIRGRDGIRKHWETKVVKEQAEIECELLALYVDGNTAVAEWEAQFDDLSQNVRKRMREVAILEFDGLLISSLREYWTSERTGPPRSSSMATAV